VDMHIQTLRQKLGPYRKLIETVRGVGYRLEAKQ
jgi:DNA-binding response OmpR family regulator